MNASFRAREEEEARHGAALQAMTRAVLVAFPATKPQAVALIDVGEHRIMTFVGEQLLGLQECLASFEMINAMDVRGLLRVLGIEAAGRRLGELGPSQKTMTLDGRGRTLKITSELLIRGSCGIHMPFGDPKKLSKYLEEGDEGSLRRRLSADVKSLYSMYEYGRLHGTVRLRWRGFDELIIAPWVHRDEPMLYNLKESSITDGVPLEVVVGNAPGWSDPWSRRRLVCVVPDDFHGAGDLVDESGRIVDDRDVQRARLLARDDL